MGLAGRWDSPMNASHFQDRPLCARHLVVLMLALTGCAGKPRAGAGATDGDDTAPVGLDVDLDGHDARSVGGDDCDDFNPAIHPGATEVCNLLDDDCDGLVDDADSDVVGQGTWYPDRDADAFGDGAAPELACSQPAESSATGGDCDDSRADARPGGTEVPYDGVDQDCSGSDLTDVDGDGYPSQAVGGNDCDDTNASVSPAGAESCNRIDDDCDGATDETGAAGETTWYRDDDGDGFGAATTDACAAPDGYVAVAGDCDDTRSEVRPGAAEVPYDGVDQDCSGADLTDVDGDGFTAREVGGDDCVDTSASIHPGAVEIAYDGVDQDCSGADLGDVDGDGYDAAAAGGDDCDDGRSTVHPGASEVEANGINEDCDDLMDEVEVCADGTGAYATIQEAVDAGVTLVELCAGTYVENVVTDHTLDIEGAMEDPDSVVLQAADPLQYAVFASGGDLAVRGVSFDAGLAVGYDDANGVDLDTDRFCPATGVMTVMQGMLHDAAGVVSLERSYVCLWHSTADLPDGYQGRATLVMLAYGAPAYVGGTLYVNRNVFDDGIDGGNSWLTFDNYGSNNYYSNNLIVGAGLNVNQESGPHAVWSNNTVVGAGVLFWENDSGADTEFRDNIFFETTSLGEWPDPDYPGLIYGQWFARYQAYEWETLSTCADVQPQWSNGIFFTADPYISTLQMRVCTYMYCEDDYYLESDCTSASPMVTSSILSDPLFVSDPEKGSYALGSASPAIDAGTGSRDPDGTPNDMGAFGGPDGDWYLEVPWLIP